MTAAILSSTPFTPSSTPFTWKWTSFIRSSIPATLISTLIILSSIPWTLSSMILATFKTCAAVIRASSCVSQSSLFSASSISLLPISLFRYFSEKGSVNGYIFGQQQLTRPSLSDLFRCNSEDVEDLNHYFRGNIHHFLVKCCFSVELKSLKKGFYAFE